jgi:hypothetical protein
MFLFEGLRFSISSYYAGIFLPCSREDEEHYLSRDIQKPVKKSPITV